jgi:predicted RNase H-like nuclease
MANVFLGIDGCRFGWAVVEISYDFESCTWNFFLFSTIKDIHERYFKACPIAKPDSNLTAFLHHEHIVQANPD